MTDKLLGLCLISQLLLFRLTLQLNRETELLIYFITEEKVEEEERKRNMTEYSRGIQRKEDDKEEEEKEEMREKMKRKGRER